MVLGSQSPAKHNLMLGKLSRAPESRDCIKHSAQPPAKRLKRLGDNEASLSNRARDGSSKLPADRAVTPEIPDSDADTGDENVHGDRLDRQTDLENALPPIRTDQEAIEEYEAQRAAERASGAAGLEDRMGQQKWVKGKSSIYVDAFNLALATVLDDESHLFDAAERALFEEWRTLGYEAQYLYVRLFLRKTSAWHRINRLGYYGDIANMPAAIEQLQNSRSLPSASFGAETTPGEHLPPEGTTLGTVFTFADSSEQYITTLEEASSLLNLDELKSLARTAKVKGKNKDGLIKALRRASGKQTGLEWVGLKRSDTEESVQSVEEHGEDAARNESSAREDLANGNRDVLFVRKIMNETGPCIRLTLAPLKLFERVHLVFYRSTEWTEKSLTTVILARIARRNFPEYIVSRSANVFSSRASLLEFEAALRTQFRVDSILEFNGTPTTEGLQMIVDIFEEIYPRWKALLREERQKEGSLYEMGERAYLRRLSPAWVYTRIIHKGIYVLGKFKQHRSEHEVLDELLNQRHFHTARRGAWYQRKALLEEHYKAGFEPPDGRSEEAQKKHWKRIALQTCEDGLQDRLVHLIYHYDLQKRVMKLEKALKIAKREQHDFGHVRLAKPVERTVSGIQIVKDYTNRPRAAVSTNSKPAIVRASSDSTERRRGAKTIWLDEREDHGECSVEAMCLSHYRSLGWKGYHAEGGILRTLFAYLFYDVLFTYVPNVFQTAYQTCPLDLHSDGFYVARISEINARLAEIGNGRAEEIVRRVWEDNVERRTCVVGLDWAFEIEDLCAIVRCFAGEGLGAVCLVLAQEYGQRGGGVPDLFLWKEEEGKGEVMFAEVKSENDRLSDTQRMWIHVLTGAGIKVELCNAVAKEVRKVSA